MIRLEKLQALGRTIRQDDIEDLGIPTWTLVREAIHKGEIEQAITYLDYACREVKNLHDSICGFVGEALSCLAGFGEEEVYKLLRRRYEPVIHKWTQDTPGVKESLERCVEFQRGHGGNLSIREEPDRFVLVLHPCGSGGLVRKNKNVGTVKKAYPWTWGKRDVSVYCVHCCVMWEVLPTEFRGYPIRIHLLGDDPEDPCTLLFYKKPELIPDEYLKRIGLSPKPHLQK